LVDPPLPPDLLPFGFFPPPLLPGPLSGMTSSSQPYLDTQLTGGAERVPGQARAWAAVQTQAIGFSPGRRARCRGSTAEPWARQKLGTLEGGPGARYMLR